MIPSNRWLGLILVSALSTTGALADDASTTPRPVQPEEVATLSRKLAELESRIADPNASGSIARVHSYSADLDRRLEAFVAEGGDRSTASIQALLGAAGWVRRELIFRARRSTDVSEVLRRGESAHAAGQAHLARHPDREQEARLAALAGIVERARNLEARLAPSP